MPNQRCPAKHYDLPWEHIFFDALNDNRMSKKYKISKIEYQSFQKNVDVGSLQINPLQIWKKKKATLREHTLGSEKKYNP